MTLNINNNLRIKFIFHACIFIFFLIFNPFYALIFSSLINVVYKKIGFIFFSILFALSFALIFTNRDPQFGGDVLFYLERYKDISFLDSLRVNGFIEPGWELYSRTLSLLSWNNLDFFVFFTYFLLFFLISKLSELIFKDDFVIVLFVLIFFNFALLFGVFHIWRNTLAILLIFIGIYSSNIRQGLLIFIAPTIHIVTLPFVFILKKIDFRILLILLFFVLIFSGHIINRLNAYSDIQSSGSINTYFLILVSFLICIKLFKLINFSIEENKLLYLYIIYASLPYFLELNSAYAVIYDRFAYIFMLFGAIIISKLIIVQRLSLIFIMTYFFYRVGFSFNSHDTMQNLISLGDGKPFYIFNGLYQLIEKYNFSRWSDYLM